MENESSWIPRSRLQLLAATLWLGLRSGHPFRLLKSAWRLLRDVDGIDREKDIDVMTKELMAVPGGRRSETWLRWQAAEAWDTAFRPDADRAAEE